MPTAHVCPACGGQLAALPAAPDPIYRLRIVVCPGCREAWVRRRHPILAGWRRMRQIAFALATLISQMLVGFLFAAGFVSLADEIELTLRQSRLTWYDLFGLGLNRPGAGPLLDRWFSDTGREVVVLTVFVAILAGIWIAATLRHIPVLARSVVLLVPALLILLIDAAVLDMLIGRLQNQPVSLASAREIPGRAAAVLLMSLVALLATPVGRATSSMARGLRTRLFASRRNRLRRRRRSQ
jgi:hypothetical protein